MDYKTLTPTHVAQMNKSTNSPIFKFGGKKLLLTVVIAALCVVSMQLRADEKEADDQNIESFREKQIERWNDTGIVTPKSVTEYATKIFSLPVGQQRIKDLKLLAEKANAASNYVGLILDEYANYYRENYRYESIQEKVAPFHDAYAKISNDMKDYRNRAYFNLGKKHLAKNELITSLFYFRDAYRLSAFNDRAGRSGMRYMAEQEMKKLLGIENEVKSFVSRW